MLRFLIALALLVSLPACDTVTDDPDDDPSVQDDDDDGPTAATVTLALDWGRIYVIGDCESPIFTNTGDFRFAVSGSSDLDGATSSFNVMNREFAVDAGDDVGVVGDNESFDLLEGQMGSVVVDFSGSESDPTGPDPDLSPSSGSQTHTFDGTRWSNLGTRTITLGTDDDCKAELRYEASSSTS